MLFLLNYMLLIVSLVAARGCNLVTNLSCTSGAHIVFAKASLEPQGLGIIGVVARHISSKIPNSNISALEYPPIYEPYKPSRTEGVGVLTEMIKQYAALCPETKMIILGYSQGAHVLADVVCGASSVGFPTTKPQPLNIANKIVAIILMGDPSTTKGQAFHVGSSESDGIFPRQTPNGCHYVSGKTMYFCDGGDPFYEAGGHDLSTRMRYVSAYGQMAADFAVSMFHHT